MAKNCRNSAAAVIRRCDQSGMAAAAAASRWGSMPWRLANSRTVRGGSGWGSRSAITMLPRRRPSTVMGARYLMSPAWQVCCCGVSDAWTRRAASTSPAWQARRPLGLWRMRRQNSLVQAGGMMGRPCGSRKLMDTWAMADRLSWTRSRVAASMKSSSLSWGALLAVIGVPEEQSGGDYSTVVPRCGGWSVQYGGGNCQRVGAV